MDRPASFCPWLLAAGYSGALHSPKSCLDLLFLQGTKEYLGFGEINLTFDLDTSEKIISSAAGCVVVLGAVVGFLKRKRRLEREAQQPSAPSISNVQTVNVNVGADLAKSTNAASGLASWPDKTIPSLKRNANILFVDDDKGFKMSSILKKMGWEHTRQIADIANLEQQALVEAHVIFVDIQGVGKAMHYADEGLGLALAIKRRHPQKGVVIYSAETHGARFHDALQEADFSLPKTAEPIRFEDVIVKILSK